MALLRLMEGSVGEEMPLPWGAPPSSSSWQEMGWGLEEDVTSQTILLYSRGLTWSLEQPQGRRKRGRRSRWSTLNKQVKSLQDPRFSRTGVCRCCGGDVHPHRGCSPHSHGNNSPKPANSAWGPTARRGGGGDAIPWGRGCSAPAPASPAAVASPFSPVPSEGGAAVSPLERR